MKLDVRDQMRLPFRRLLEICLDSVGHRLMRSLVTVTIILLAIAFLAFIMIEVSLGRATRETVSARAAKQTAYSRFLRKTSQLPPDEKLVRFIASIRVDSTDFRNLQSWAGLDDEEAAVLISRSETVRDYLEFLSNIPIGRRALLVGQHQGTSVFDWLAEEENFQRFTDRLKAMRSVRVPGEISELVAFLDDWDSYSHRLQQVKNGYQRAQRNVADWVGDRGIDGALREAAEEDRTDAFFETLASMGLEIEAGQQPLIVEGLRHHDRLQHALDLLRRQPVRLAWNREFREEFNPGAALESCATSDRRVQWVGARLREAGMAEDFDADALRDIAVAYAARQRLVRQDQSLTARYGESDEMGAKTVWLITVSFLVCVVGIANAMLMSVLERFKEIATMKCLGARNNTIAFLFITESTMIGVIGGLCGMVLGFVIAFGRLTAGYGGLVVERFPGTDVATALIVCSLCSLLLAGIAAIYPARVASRMAPMEAMRVD